MVSQGYSLRWLYKQGVSDFTEINYCVVQASLHAANNKRELLSSIEQDCEIQLMPMAPYKRLPLSQSWLAFTLAQVTTYCSSVVATATMATIAAFNTEIGWMCGG